MNRKILKSNGAFVLVGEYPSWKTSNDYPSFFPLVQNLTFGLANERQQVKQLGNKNYIVNDLIRSPDINLNIDYYLSPYLCNESLLGFNVGFVIPQSIVPPGGNFLNNNFYVVIDNREGIDASTEIRKRFPEVVDFSGFSVISFGNCYLTKYSLSCSVGQTPMVSTSYLCSNMKTDNMINNVLTIPAINLESGNAINAGVLDLGNLNYPIISGKLEQDEIDISKLSVASVGASFFSLENLQVSGIPLSGANQAILQNLDFNLDFNRDSIYGFGSNYVYDRKLKYPIIGTVDIQAFVSGLNSGFITGMIEKENKYNFDISFKSDKNPLVTGFYNFKNLKLESFNYSMSVNNIMNFSASFSLEIGNSDSLYMSRWISGVQVWAVVDDLWNLSEILWS